MGRMPDRLTDAARAYRAALEAVETTRAKLAAEAARKVAQATARADAARDELHRAIVQADQAGVRQRVIVNATGYSRERIRQIVRAAGGSM
jgi:hypothetical protein